ncbi:MAG: serine/threonine protein kinase, partial [Bacteroidales bacterium]|nr:serine/threonine protein kinase [Bacteroidales bacterium]
MQNLQQGTILQSGKYEIKEMLGQGGFGITYLAIQSGLERKVAIKEFFMNEICERDPETNHVIIGTEGGRETFLRYREKFVKEARNIAKL